MTVGIISKGCVLKKRGFLKRFSGIFEKRYIFKNYDFCGAKIVAAKIKKEKNFATEFKKAVAELEKKADLIVADKKIFFDKLLAEPQEIYTKKLCFFKEKDLKKVFLNLETELYFYLAKKQGLQPKRMSVLFEDSGLETVNLEFLKSFCLCASLIGIKTESNGFEKFSNELFCETGCCLQRAFSADKGFDAVISVDGGWIKFLDKAFVNRFEFGFEDICKAEEVDPFLLCFVLKKVGILPHIKEVSGRCAVFEY